MAKWQAVTRSAEETIERGREVGAKFKSPLLVLLFGELGAGKTTLTKGLVSGLGAADEDQVTSPTFTLVHKYGDDATVYHVDFYRVGNFRDLESLGLEDFLNELAIVIIEWPEKFSLRADWPIIRIHLEHLGEDARRLSVSDESDALGSQGALPAPWATAP